MNLPLGDGDFCIYREDAPVPSGLSALSTLFTQARSAGLTLTILSHPATPEVRSGMAKRVHDLKAALRTLGFTRDALESGYRFQDGKATAKIDAITQAVKVLEREGKALALLLITD